MITLPWIHGPAARAKPDSVREPQPAMTVMASRLELRSLRHVPAFLIASLRLRRAIAETDGAIGLTLRARPLARTFWTLSVWTDRQALQAYNRTPLHRGIVERFRPRMASSTFRFYSVADGTTPQWDEALRRLSTPQGQEHPVRV